jgi:hypothetical protein
MLPGERIAFDAAVRQQPRGEGVVDLVLRSERQQLREVAVAHPLGRHVRHAVVARPRLGNRLVAVHEERPVPHDRAVGRHRPARVAELRQRDVVRVGEEVVREELRRGLHEIRRAAEGVGPRFEAEVRHAAFRVAEGGVEGRRLNLELLDDVLRRHERGGDLSRSGRGRARHAVDRDVAPVGARAVHRVADDVRRLEGAVEPGRTHERGAGRQADERERVAVRRRQLGDAACVHHLAERRARRVEQRRRGDDRDLFGGAADLEHHLELQPIADAQLHLVVHEPCEALHLGGTRYCPGSRYGAWKNPTSLVTTVTSVPMARLVMVTVAPGRTPRLLSRTEPVMVPLASWAIETAGRASTATTNARPRTLLATFMRTPLGCGFPAWRPIGAPGQVPRDPVAVNASSRRASR